MSRMKLVADWFVLPFGSLKMLVILVSILFVGRIADLGSTYWFLSQAEFNLANEANLIFRTIFSLCGFFCGATANLFLSVVHILLASVVPFHFLRKTRSVRLAKVVSATILISFGIRASLAAIHNFQLFSFLSLILFPYSLIWSNNYLLFMFNILTQLVLIALVVAFFLYKVGYGREKVLSA